MKTRNQPETGNKPDPAGPLKNKNLHEILEIRYNKILHLRRNSRLFLAIGYCLSLLLVISAFQYKVFDPDKPVRLESTENVFDVLPDIKNTVFKTPPPPKITSPEINIVDDEEPVNNPPDLIDMTSTEDMKLDNPVIVDNNTPEIEKEKTDKPVLFPESPAQPAGGFEAFYEFLGKNIQYPKLARQLDIEGRVTLTFVVERDGTLSDIEILKGIGGGCDEEAIRVLAIAPKWTPGKQRGVPVRVRMTIPVVFRLRR